jgi:hypothetical protein
MNFGIKHRIINITSDLLFLKSDGDPATEVANLERLSVPGTVTLIKAEAAKISAYRATAPVNEVATLTFASGSAGAADVSLTLDISTTRNIGEFERYSSRNGKKYVFGASVADASDVTNVATGVPAKIKGIIDARISRYDDVPFSVTISGAVITVTAKHAHLKIETAVVTSSGTAAPLVTVATTTLGSEGKGNGSQIEENVSMLTGADALAGSAKGDERVIVGDKYALFSFSKTFSDAAAAEPQAAGLGNDSGSVDIALYINEKLSSDVKVLLLTEWFITEGGTVLKSDDSAVTGDNAAKTVDFWA